VLEQKEKYSLLHNTQERFSPVLPLLILLRVWILLPQIQPTNPIQLSERFNHTEKNPFKKYSTTTTLSTFHSWETALVLLIFDIHTRSNVEPQLTT